MATTKEKIAFYLDPKKAAALRAVALEQRRTVTAILEYATDKVIEDHQSNGSAASSQGKRDRAEMKGR